MVSSKKVCVVGAGVAGLASARELLREGQDVTVMEQSGGVGGQWLYDPRTDASDALGAAGVHSSVYASLRLNAPRDGMGFSDFPFFPKNDGTGDTRRYPGHGECLRYIRDFCDAFGLMDVIRLNTKVLRVGPLFEHTFPPALAPSLSFVGVPRLVLVPRFYEAQARWVAQVLSGRRTLPPEEEMVRATEEYHRAREAAGVPKRLSHTIFFDMDYCDEFGAKHCGFPPVEEWKRGLVSSAVARFMDGDVENYRDSDLVLEGLRSEGW